MNKLAQTLPRPVFDCIVHNLDSSSGLSTGPESVFVSDQLAYSLYDVIILQLGSFTRYKMYHPASDESDGHAELGQVLQVGDVVQCHLYRRVNNPLTFILIPVSLNMTEIHPSMLKDIATISNSNGNGNGNGNGYGNGNGNGNGNSGLRGGSTTTIATTKRSGRGSPTGQYRRDFS